MREGATAACCGHPFPSLSALPKNSWLAWNTWLADLLEGRGGHGGSFKPDLKDPPCLSLQVIGRPCASPKQMFLSGAGEEGRRVVEKGKGWDRSGGGTFRSLRPLLPSKCT